MITSIDSWRDYVKSIKTEEILIRFSSNVNNFDSELQCSCDIPPPPSFTWEGVGKILLSIYRHSSELLTPIHSKEVPVHWTGCTELQTNSNYTLVTLFNKRQPPSCSPPLDDEEKEPGIMYSEPPIQRSFVVPPIKIRLAKKKDEHTKDSVFEVSHEDFFRLLNSQGRLDLHFCFCWLTRKTPFTNLTEGTDAAWTHKDFTSLAEGLRCGEEEAMMAIESLFRATEKICLSLEKYHSIHKREEASEIERALLCVIGSRYAGVRKRALTFLEMLYNGHTMEFKGEEKCAIKSVGDKVDIYLEDVSENGDTLSTRSGSSLYVQVFCCGSVFWRKFWGYSKQRRGDKDNLKFTLLHSAELPGFYHWRLVDYDAEKGEIKEMIRKGRFVVLPASKENAKTDQICSFMESKNTGNRVNISTTELRGGEREDLCVMNFPLSVSALSWNRRYKKFLSLHCEPGSGNSLPTYSVALSPETGLAVLNYRIPETVESMLKDMRLWIDKKGNATKRIAVVLQGDWPYICAPAANEMERIDEDGEFHYQNVETSLESPLVNQKKRFLMETDSGANLILSKIARGIWSMLPRAILYIETTSSTQYTKALYSGFIPVDKTMESILAHGTYEKIKAHVPAQGSAVPVIRVPPGIPEISPFARVLIQFGFVSVLGKTLNPINFLFENEENDDYSGIRSRIYSVEWHGLNGAQEGRIISFAAKQKDRLVLVAFLPEGSRGTTAEPGFSDELMKLVPEVLCVSSVPRRGSLSLVPPQHMSREEFLHEHHFTDFTPGSDGIQVWTITSSSCSDDALYESSIYRLAGLIDRKISPIGNMVYNLLREATETTEYDSEKANILIKRLRRNVSSPASRTLGRVLSHLFYVGHDLPLGLLSTLRYNCAEVLRGNELGAIVFVSAEMGRFSTVGGVGVLVDELTRSIARQGYKVFVVTPYFNYNKYGHTDYLRPEDGFSYRGNITVGIGDWEQQSFGVHVGKENGVDLVFLHNYTYFPTPYSGETADYKLRSVVALSKAALHACAFLNIRPSM